MIYAHELLLNCAIFIPKIRMKDTIVGNSLLNVSQENGKFQSYV